MKRFLLLLFFISFVSAQDIQLYRISFNINQDMSVREEIKIVFETPLNKTDLTYHITGNFYDLSVNNTFEKLDYVIENQNFKKIRFLVPEGTQQIFISFSTKDIVKEFNGKKEILTTLKFPDSKRIVVYIFLPAGYSIYKNTYLPENSELLTDGERIYLKWYFDVNETPIMVRFYRVSSENVYILFSLLFFSLGVTMIFLSKKDDKFLIGFSNDERKVIEILIKRKVEMQNKIEKELGFSRAKMTRITKKLESKGLIKKEKMGKTNKIIWS